MTHICNYYRFHDFHSPPLDDADFDAKPMILLVGQYSTGKTTFIKYLLEQEFPGMRIGPEPTTDCFIIITKVRLVTCDKIRDKDFRATKTRRRGRLMKASFPETRSSSTRRNPSAHSLPSETISYPGKFHGSIRTFWL